MNRTFYMAVTGRAGWRDWCLSVGLLGLNLAIAIFVVLGACDAAAWMFA